MWSSSRSAVLGLLLAVLTASAVADGSAASPDAREQAITTATSGAWSQLPGQPGNPPIREVALAGDATFGAHSGRAVLLLGCRTDTPAFWIMVRTPEDGLGFPVAEFEGPDGAGEQKKLGRLSGLGPVRPLYLSGSFQTGAFQFDWSPGRAEIGRWQQAGGTTVRLEIADRRGNGKALNAAFRLPTNATALQQTLSSCGAH
jgi:hypothetical protein